MSTIELSATQSQPVPAKQPETACNVTPTERLRPPMPHQYLERVEAWGMNTSVMSYVFRPSTADGIRDVFETARRHGLKVGMRGGGRSYGDASLAAEDICLDLSRMNRILEWNPMT